MKSKRSNKKLIVLITFLLIPTFGVVMIAQSRVISRVYYLATKAYQLNKRSEPEFPEIDQSDLSQSQIRLINVLRNEYKLKPNNYDANVMKYTQGIREPWCADFVSWTYREAGMPLNNPNSGSWRIPGTQTLKQYFRDQGVWHDYQLEPNYQPKTGDVIIYKIGESPFGQHTNIVLKNNKGKLTTIGGNEFRAVRIQSFQINDEMGIDGYGELLL